MKQLNETTGGNMKKSTLAAAALLVLGIFGVSLVTADGFGGFGKGIMGLNSLTDEERQDLQIGHEAIRTAIEEGDYETWESLMQDQINPETFDKLANRHQEMSQFRIEMQTAIQNNDRETVNQLREGYDFPNIGRRHAVGRHMMSYQFQNSQE